MIKPLLSVKDLRIQFVTRRGMVQAVDGVSFDIMAGETLAVVGESGSGKTVTGRSLIRLLASPPAVYAGGQALFRPRGSCRACTGSGCKDCDQTGAATIDLLGVSDAKMRVIRGNSISMVFQDPGKSLNPTMTVRQQLAEVFLVHSSSELLHDTDIRPERSRLVRRAARDRAGWATRQLLRLPPWRTPHRKLMAEVDERIAAALADTHIANPRQVMQSYPHELSGGMKQRVVIAQALACEPDLLIADEPTTALDVTIQARILDLIAELQDRHNTAVLYISHDLTVVRRISDRVAVMYAGRLVEAAPAEELFADPTHPYTHGLLAAVPSAGQARGQLMAIQGSVPELIDPPLGCRFGPRCPIVLHACSTRDPVLRSHGNDTHVAACLVLDEPSTAAAGDPSESRQL